MARQLRVQFPGATYHVVSRGTERRNIFHDDEDRKRLLWTLGDVAERLHWDVWSYCLMDNHYHLLVQTPDPSLAQGMRDVNSRYAQRFNRRHDRVGPLFQGRYGAFVVDHESYLFAVARYIVLNPVRAGCCALPGQWRWSSFRVMLQGEGGPPWLRTDRALAAFDRDPPRARRAFVRFVHAGIGLPDPAAEPHNQLVVGNAAFGASIRPQAPPHPSPEVPRCQRRAFTTLGDFAGGHLGRDQAISAAWASGMYTLAEIGERFGLHYSTVNKIVSKHAARVKAKI